MQNITDYAATRELLSASKTIAVVGLSPKQERPSNMVARYLLDVGYTIYPVNPGHELLLGLPCYPSLADIPGPVDIVDIFRRSEQVVPVVEEAVSIEARAVWMQQGVINHEAKALAEENGLMVIMDRCIKIDHSHLFPGAVGR